MVGIFPTILHWLTPDVTVEIRPEVVVLQCQDRNESIEPVVWIAGKGRQQRLVAVGSSPPMTQPAKRIELFALDENGMLDRERLECLAAFWRYGLLKVIGRKLFIRPAIFVRDFRTVPRSKQNDSRITITHALELAGAHEVRWENLAA